MADMFPICRPHPNWIPKNPKLMFQICQKRKAGLVVTIAGNYATIRRRLGGISLPIRNPKAQISSTKESQISNTQYSMRAPPVWNLKLGISLGFEVWCLEFSLARHFDGRAT